MGFLDRIRAAKRPDPSVLREGDDRVEPQGASGTINYRGLIQPEEYNPDLKFPKSIDVYTRMWRSDAAVRETLWHIFAPILNAQKVIDPPPEPSDEELEQAEFIRCVFFEWLDQSFEEFLVQALSCLPLGSAYFETCFKVIERELRVPQLVDPEAEEGEEPAESPDDDEEAGATAAATPPPSNQQPKGPPPEDPVEKVPTPQPPRRELRTVPKRQFVALTKLHQRLLRTITEFHVDEWGELTHIEQLVPKKTEDDGQGWVEVEIEASHLLSFVFEKVGDDYTGTSILRGAYKAWVIKEMIEKIAGIAYERHGVGIPVAYVPRDREGDVELIAELEELLANLRAGESTYLVFPGPKAQGNTIGYHFEIVSPQGGIPDFTKILEYLRGEIKGSVLIRFSELGHAQSGARATASVQSEVWYAALHALGGLLTTELDKLIRRLVDLNYPNVERYPKFVMRGIEARNLLEHAQAITLLANSQLLVADTPTRRWVREAFDAPEEDMAEAQMRGEQERQQFALEKGDTANVFEVEDDPTETARPRRSKPS